jgi:methyl-accepting chemotaxis protein
MKNQINIQRKIVLPILCTVTLLLGVFAALTVNYIRNLTRNKVESEALGLVQLNAAQITDFFKECSRIPWTFFQSPFILEWFSQYDQFRAPLENDRDYEKITDYFNRIRNNDPLIKAIFLATDNTQEYFDHEGRYEAEGYYVKDRPWWKEAMEQNRLYCGLPASDHQDGTVSSTLQMPVYLENGRFLGIGGVDILITTVGEIVSKIKYQDRGDAFLVDENGGIIYFPDVGIELPLSQEIATFDSLLSDVKGFQNLSGDMQERREGLSDVIWKDRDYIALYAPVRASIPYVDWTLGLLVPKDVIVGTIRRVTVISVFAVVVAIACISALMSLIMSSLTRPLNILAHRLDEIANQSSDLTRELPVESNDAIGQTARNFNTFISHIRQLLTGVISNTKDVVERTGLIHRHSADISTEAQVMSSQATQVATTSQELMQTIDEINEGVQKVAELSQRSNLSVEKGQSLISERIAHIEEISGQMMNTYEEMERLSKKSDEVSETVQAIDDISDKISLLALNASIEAARAGESGRGFAVVADEVQKLSHLTYQENAKTSTLLDEFRNDIQKLYKDIKLIKDSMSDEIKSSEAIISTFRSLNDDVKETDLFAGQMKDKTSKQVDFIRLVDQNIQQISKATEHIAQGINDSFLEISNVDNRVKELQKSTEKFKVE